MINGKCWSGVVYEMWRSRSEGEEGVGQVGDRRGGRSGADCTPCYMTLDISGDEILGWEMLGKGKRGEKEGRCSRGEEGVGQGTEKGMTRSGRMIEGREGEKERR